MDPAADPKVPSRRPQAGVSEQSLDHGQGDTILEKVAGEGCPQRGNRSGPTGPRSPGRPARPPRPRPARARLQQTTATLQAERARSRALSQQLTAERQGRQRAEQERRAAQRQLARLQAEITEMEEVMNQATATILECCP